MPSIFQLCFKEIPIWVKESKIPGIEIPIKPNGSILFWGGKTHQYFLLKGEINNNNPSVIMFYPAVFGRTHATTMVGYQIIDGTNYVTVCDPYQETYSTRTIIWNTSNVYGFFLLERRSKLTL